MPMTLEQAVARLRSIHSGEQPYVSDKAFSAEQIHAVVDEARKALADDAKALISTFDELLHKASLAPSAAKTMPSQALAIALGKVVEAVPTPEAILILGSVVREVRHAGIKKKLQRNLRTAERMLAQRPEVALRLPRDRSPSRMQVTTLKRALEAGFSSGLTWTFDDWRERFVEHPHASTFAEALIWRVSGAAGEKVAAMPTAEHGRLERDGPSVNRRRFPKGV